MCNQVLRYTPHYNVLHRGWFLFNISKEEDNTLLLQWSWNWGPSGLILRKSHIDFNARREPHNLQQIWAILPGLPMVFWQQHILEAIGNKIGKFIKLEDDWVDKIDLRCAQILIEIDMRDSIYEEIVRKMHGSILTQWVDYWKLLFHCFNYRKVGHIQENCSVNTQR